MHICLDIEIRPRGVLDDEEMENFSQSDRRIVEAFDEEFQKYHVRRKRPHGYKITSKDGKYEDFWRFHERYKEQFDIVVYGNIEYDEEDFFKAEAFILTFMKQCYYYDGWNEEKYDCLETVSPVLGQWHPKAPIYIKLPANTRKEFAMRPAGANTPDFESYLSPQLYEYLISCGIEKEFFRPAYAKNNPDDPIAWRLWGADHVLPPESFMPFDKPEEHIWLQDADTGYVKWVWDEPEDSDIDDEEEDDDEGEGEDYMPDWEFYLNGDFEVYQMTLNKEGIEQLAWVNEAYECIGNIRPTLIKKELFWLIEEKVPNIKRRSTPVFFSEHPKGGYKKLRIRE